MGNYENRTPKITVIPAKPRQALINPNYKGEITKLRVAAYARVSTDHEEQESSYEAQVEHFTKYISAHEDWELAGIYADPGLSGKNTKRKEFQRLMSDCEEGKIDRVITKSVSRFARNTLDCVQCVRKLKEKGIGVYFEKESLDTLQASSEFVLTVMASLAEEESRSISTNIRWSVKKRFADGKVMLSTKHFLGYKRDENKNLVIVPEEALIIRRIYAEFLNGYSLQQIANNLMDDGVLSPSGKDVWYVSTIKSILQNEKYKGDSHLQKTYLPDFLSPRRIKNEGQAMSWYVEDSHAAIISKETFDMVQQEFVNRNEIHTACKESGKGKYSGKYPFSGMITCGECGETYRRHQQYTKTKKYYIWVCKRKENTGNKNCPSRPIHEEALKRAFVRALNEIIMNGEEILETVKESVISTISEPHEKWIAEIQAVIDGHQRELAELLKLRQNDGLDDKEYERQSAAILHRIDEQNFKKSAILIEQSKMELLEYRIEKITKLLSDGKLLQEFDESIFKSMVKEINIIRGREVEFKFECGINVREIAE